MQSNSFLLRKWEKKKSENIIIVVEVENMLIWLYGSINERNDNQNHNNNHNIW